MNFRMALVASAILASFAQVSVAAEGSGKCFVDEGISSFYHEPQAVASGGRFDPDAMTAAHPNLPFGTVLLVTNLNNGRQVEVEINDRGPYYGSRILDLSRAAFAEIADLNQGLVPVRIETAACSQ